VIVRDFGKGLVERAKAKPQNYQVVMNEAFDLHGKDFTPLLQKVKAANANAFMADAHLDDYITMQRQYKQAGLHHEYVTYGARGPEKSAREALGVGDAHRLHLDVPVGHQRGDRIAGDRGDDLRVELHAARPFRPAPGPRASAKATL